jgi:hypothetical protein
MTTGAEFARLAAQRRKEADEAMGQIAALRSEHREKREEVARRYEEAAGELLALLLPGLDAIALQRAAAVLAYPAILSWGVLDHLAEEKTQLAKRIAEIEADPRYKTRELLLAPGVGKLMLALAEQQDFRKPFAETLSRASHPMLNRLLESGYGTPDYEVQWWRLSFYKLWEAGDQVLEKFPGAKAFEDIRGEIIEAKKAVASFDAKIKEIKAQVAAIRALETEYNDSRQKLANSDADALTETRTRIRRHLEDLDYKNAGGTFQTDPAYEAPAKRSAGQWAKLTYMDAMARDQLAERENALRTELAKLDRTIAKFSRPKHAHTRIPTSDTERLRTRRDKDRKFFDRYHRSYETVYVFHDYNRGSIAEDFLWWDLMTDGHLDGNFIPEVQEFRNSHPNYDWDSDAAAAVAGQDYNPSGPNDDLADAS